MLRFLRSRRQKAFGAQFPDALDMIVRSLRAGHPTPIALTMVAREMQDPIGSEFGIVVDEITYGADLETALRNLYFRIGQDDLPLFVTAVAIQGSTGGNLGEILENLSAVIRQRFKMRRKIRALAAEGRASALILSSLPIAMFLIIQIVSPDFYASVWDIPLTKQALDRGRRLDGDRQFHHVPARELQDLIDERHLRHPDQRVRRPRSSMMLALMVFLAVAVLAFGVMAAVHARSSVKRRAAGIAEYSGEREADREELAARLERAGRCSACSTTPPSTIRPTDRPATPRSCGAG